MKKYFISVLLGSILLTGLSSCFHHHDVAVSISDDTDEYEINAPYKKGQTHHVQVFVDERLAASSMVSVEKRSKDKRIILDHESKFYLNTNPREIRIHIGDIENAEELREIVKDIRNNIREEIDENFEDN